MSGAADLPPVGGFTVPPAHPSLPGHFPGDPLVPGVVLLDHVLDLAAAGRPVLGVGAKFLAVVRGGDRIEVAARCSGPARLDLQARRGEETVLRGSARLGPMPPDRDSPKPTSPDPAS